MKCEHCQYIMPIEGFSGYLHYTSTKRSMDKLVDMRMFEISSITTYEIIYHCKKCSTSWALAAPDFPIKGYLTQRF